MHVKNGFLAAALCGLTLVIANVSAQDQAPAGGAQPPAGQGQGRGGRRGGGGAQAPAAPGAPAPAPGRGAVAPGGGRAQATFPAQQRPPDDPAVVARGKGLYGVNCQLCHGVDLRGGDGGGPNLLRSPETLNDKDGERLMPIMKAGKPPRMPASTLTDDDLHAIAIYLHSIAATMQGQGGPPRGNPVPGPEQVLVGNVAAGQQYFAAKCSTCHSATGDLAGIGSRITDPRLLQNSWVGGNVGGGGGRGGGRGGQTTVTVTMPSGQKVDGTLVRVDEFLVIVRMADGGERTIPRNGDVPKVEIKDPRDAHRQLMTTLQDKDMHNVTAYLASLK